MSTPWGYFRRDARSGWRVKVLQWPTASVVAKQIIILHLYPPPESNLDSLRVSGYKVLSKAELLCGWELHPLCSWGTEFP